MSEDHDTRLKRLRMRAGHRGIKEMDIVLGGFADRGGLSDLDANDLDTFEAILGENDQDLLSWVTGQEAAPERYATLLARLTEEAADRF